MLSKQELFTTQASYSMEREAANPPKLRDVSAPETRETLDQYVRRILKIKGLTLADVSRRSGGMISDSHICNITNGKSGSLTIAKLKALASGLGVPEDEVFAVARGVPADDGGAYKESAFARLFQKYETLPEDEKREVAKLLQMVDREIQWRQARIHHAFAPSVD